MDNNRLIFYINLLQKLINITIIQIHKKRAQMNVIIKLLEDGV